MPADQFIPVTSWTADSYKFGWDVNLRSKSNICYTADLHLRSLSSSKMEIGEKNIGSWDENLVLLLSESAVMIHYKRASVA